MRGFHDRDQLSDRRLQGAQQLGEENLARRQVGQLPDLVGRENATLDKPALDVELEPRLSDPLVDELRRQAQVVVTERDGDRSFELLFQRRNSRGFGRAPGQGVLDDSVLVVDGSQIAAQVMYCADDTAWVVG